MDRENGMYKRFLVFSGMQYYPSGGMDDFSGSFDSIEEARESLKKDLATPFADWGHIYDQEERERVD